MNGSRTFSASTNLLVENAITQIVGNISRKVDGTVSHGSDPNNNTLSFIRKLQSIISRYDEADVRMFCGILRNASKPIYNSIKTRSEMLAFAASLAPSAPSSLSQRATADDAMHRMDAADKKVKNATKPARKTKQSLAPVARAAANASLEKRAAQPKKDAASAHSDAAQKKPAGAPKPTASAPLASKSEQAAPQRKRGRPVKNAHGKTALERLNRLRIDRANKYKRRTKGQ